MTKSIFKIIYFVLIFQVSGLYAQEDGASSGMFKDSLNDLAIVGGCGAAGAILGLSTLSFYSQPSKHYKNILYGAAVGIIAGVGIVAFSTANKTKKGFGGSSEEEQGANYSPFEAPEKLAWHYEWQSKIEVENSLNSKDVPFFSYDFTF